MNIIYNTRRDINITAVFYIMGYESVVKKHLYEKNSHLELFMNGNEITVLDKFTNKERIKLKISGNNVQFFDGIMNHHFGE